MSNNVLSWPEVLNYVERRKLAEQQCFLPVLAWQQIRHKVSGFLTLLQPGPSHHDRCTLDLRTKISLFSLNMLLPECFMTATKSVAKPLVFRRR